MSRATLGLFSAFAFATAAACAGGETAGEPVKVYHAAAGDLGGQVIDALAARGATTLAILPLEAEGDVARTVGEMLADDLAARLANVPSVTFVERERLKSILEEVALRQALGDDERQIELGKMAGADVLLVLRASLVGEAVDVTARLMEVASGTALRGVALQIRYDDALQATIADRNARANIRTSKEVAAAFGELRAGDLASAESFFAPLAEENGERRSVGSMGLAAVAYARGQADRAVELCQVSRQLSGAPTYCWVIEGRVAGDRGATDDARELLTKAVADSGTLIDWQKALAANTLGRMAVAAGDVEQALAMFDRAVALDPSNTEAVSNKARILEERGDLATAILLYQQGLKADPDDAVLALLLRDAEMRQRFAEDAAHQQKIAALASDLVAGKAKGTNAAANDASWTTASLTVTMLPIEEKGAPAKRLGETEFIEGSLRSSLAELPGVELVDRQLLAKVLEEMQLSGSNLGDEATALRVGKVLAARVLFGGTIVRMDGETQVSLKLIETETTRVLGAVNEIFDGGARLSEVVAALGAAARDKLGRAYPVRGVAGKVDGKRVEIDVGADVGVAAGDTFIVYDRTGEKTVGQAKVVEVGSTSAWLELQDGAAKVRTGARVQRKP